MEDIHPHHLLSVHLAQVRQGAKREFRRRILPLPQVPHPHSAHHQVTSLIKMGWVGFRYHLNHNRWE